MIALTFPHKALLMCKTKSTFENKTKFLEIKIKYSETVHS